MDNFQTVYQMLSEIKQESSKNKKIILLKDFLQNEAFKTVAQMALAHNKIYHVSSIGKFLPDQPKSSFEEVIQYLTYLTEKSGTTKAEKQTLQRMASSSREAYHIVSCIVKKDLRCGAAAGLINKGFPGTIFTVPYQRCMTEKEGMARIHYDAICQKKGDGTFAYGMIDRETGKPTFMTRNGFKFDLCNQLDDDLEILREDDWVMTMELIAIDPEGNDYPREYGNGLLNKAIQGTITPEEASCIQGFTWDVIPQAYFWKEIWNCPYIERWKHVTSLSRDMGRIHRIPSRIVKNETEARDYFQQMRRKGFEGAVLKNLDGIWKSHTSPNQVKLKRKFQAEFIITGWYKGEAGKKYENCLGGLNFESSDGLVKCNTGSGFLDGDRGFEGFDDSGIPIINDSTLEEWDNSIGDRIGVEFDSLVTDKSRADIYSLFLPIYTGKRMDKNEADDLPYLLKLTGAKV